MLLTTAAGDSTEQNTVESPVGIQVAITHKELLHFSFLSFYYSLWKRQKALTCLSSHLHKYKTKEVKVI